MRCFGTKYNQTDFCNECKIKNSCKDYYKMHMQFVDLKKMENNLKKVNYKLKNLIEKVEHLTKFRKK